MSELRDTIERSIHARGLLRRGERVLVAVSGGVDSMVLLQVLQELSKKHRWLITVAHLNHQLRGRSSDADQRLVLRTAERLGVEVVAERVDVKKLARTGKLSMEMAARKARHEFLARTAARLNISKVALAHHADDQVELFFLRLLRGSGSEGLAGMKWRSPSPANAKIQLVRPLLEQSKESLRAYAGEEKIPFREDASNGWLDIQRNRIRRELLPLLKRNYQPALERTILRVMEILREESEFVKEVAEGWQLSWHRDGAGTRRRGRLRYNRGAVSRADDFKTLPVAIQRRCIQAQLLGRGIPADFGLVERLREAPGKWFTILPGISVMCGEDGRLEFRESIAKDSQRHLTPSLSPASRRRGGSESRVPNAFASGGREGVSEDSNVGVKDLDLKLEGKKGRAVFEQAEILWTVHAQKTFRVPLPAPGREVFDADKVGGQITLRHWRAGDRFQPIGMKQPVKLQDLFVNLKVPRQRRHDLIVAVSEGNEVFWVESLRISERFKLTPQTTRQLRWRWKLRKNRRLRVSTHHVRLAQRKTT